MGDNIFASGMAAFGNAYEQQNKFRQDRAKVQAGRSIASGDYAGGAAALNSAGMIDEGHNVVADQQALQDRQAASDAMAAKQRASALINIAQSLKQVPPGQRQAALQSKLPIFQSMKIDTGPFQTLDESHLTDDQLDQFSTALGKAADEYTLGEGQKRIRDGRVIAQGDPKPQEYLVLPEGGKAIPKPNQGQTVTNPAMAPMPTGAPQAAGADAPRGLRNNNPLNVTSLPHGQWDGQTGTDGKYAVFQTEAQGVAAADKNLQAYATHHGVNTLAGVIQRWAPPSENDTGSYIATVSKTLGVDPNQPLDLTDAGVRRQVLGAMARVELGKPGAVLPAAQAAPQGQPGDPPGTLYGAPKAPQWQSDGKGNLVNAATGDRKIDPTASADLEANPDLVKAIIEGRAPVPTTGRQASDPKWQAAMTAAMAQDPTLDAANYATRVKTRADFATGTAAKTKTALNTALGHAGDLDSQVGALNNGPLPALNMFKNYAENQTGDPRIKTFNLTKEALMHEAMKVFSGSAGSLMEFQQLAENLKAEDSPAQQHAVIRKLVGLLASKMDALGEQYKTGMGKELDQSQIMSPHAQDVFSRISGLPRASAPAPAAATGGIIRYDAQGNRIK